MARTCAARSARLAGLAFGATDVDWSAGTGQPVHGPAASLAHAMTGRDAGLAELTGPDVEVLGGR